MEIFKLFGSVFIDNEDANKKMQDTDKKGKGIAETLGNGIKTAAKWGTAIVAGAGAAAAGVMGLATKVAGAGDRVDKLSQKLGFSREGFQEWDFILSQSGASIDSMQSGMKTLTNQFDELGKGGKVATDAFGELGLKYEDLEGLSQEEIFEKTIEALQGVEDTTKRAALANDLLGRSGSELAPLLNTSSESVAKMKQEAHDLGMVMGDDAVDGAVTLTDTIDKLQRSMGGMLNSVMAPLLPAVNQVIDSFLEFVPVLMDSVIPLVNDLVPPLLKIVEALLPPLSSLLLALLPILEPILDIIVLLIDVGIVPFIELLAEITKKIMPSLIDVFEALMPVIEPIMLAFGSIIRTVMAVITGDWEGAWQGIKDFFINIWDAIKKVAEGLVDIFGPIFEKLGKVITSIWDGIVGGIKSAINWILEGINGFIRGINKIKIPDWVPLVGGKGFSINEIPLLADGGIIRESGRVIVGETGPELINLPKGAKVTPLGNQEANIYVQLDGKTIAETVGAPLAKTIRVKTGLAY